jgi:DNA repair exonuclease SbcCD ATPase subunit/UDP-2,3-diacylglucosamine pyrophosphatase LpxH
MSKILAVSDIHIHDYPQRNPSEKYRLYQTRTVLKNIIDAAAREGAEYLVLAGDIMDKWNPRPYVQAEIKNFLDTLMSYFKEGWIIWGNHDQDNKSENSEFIDSCLSVMLPSNLHYADLQEVTLDGCRMGFMNWRPKFDLSWIDGKLDILFTHATISYGDNDQYVSQKLDESKFDLAICGDIHRAATKGKYVSIGIPQRCKMGDSEYSSAVVIDTLDRKWAWVDLNPAGNLMRFEYTGKREEEGWDETTGIWKVYKPDNLSLTGGIRDIKVPAWKEINILIQQIIIQNQLSEVHGEVLKRIKDIDGKEVDFNFVLLRFACKNWRSIDECEIYFNDLDRILITGENGSGKSSLLSAIRYAFLENRSIKDFLQFGAKDCYTEVEFLYQGNTYVIQRGYNSRGYTKLWMNGEEQKANSKADLDEDIHNRFPFIDYMDVYFFDSDHHKLIGGITPERKSEIISKFYKMDKIDAFHEEAKEIYESHKEILNKWKVEIDKGNEVIKYVEDKLNSINLPNLSKEELEKKKEEGILMQAAWKEWNDYRTKTANLQARKEIYIKKQAELGEQIRNFQDQNSIRLEIQKREQVLTWIATETEKLRDLVKEGKRLRSERNQLDSASICRTCGRPLDNQEAIETHKAELDRKLQDLTMKWREQDSLIRNTLNEDPDKVRELTNSEIAGLMAEINSQNNTYSELKGVDQNLQYIESELRSLGTEPSKVELPEGFMEEMGRIESSLSEWYQYYSLVADRNRALDNIKYCQNELQKINSELQDLQDYIKLTGPTGKIYEEIMTRLAEQFSDNQVKYVVERTTFRKKEHLDLASYYLNNGNEVSYQACSSGQKTILDVNFLGKVVTRMGLLVMDEFLKHLDVKNHDICIDMLKEMNIGCILLSSHMESVPAFNNKSLTLELNESGISKIQMK